MAQYVKCYRMDCFGNKCGMRCEILSEKPDALHCPFYKTDKEVDEGRAAAHKRLKEIGREDLIKKYEYNSQRRW